MLKRILPFVMALALLLPCFAVSASASAYEINELTWTVKETATTYEIVMNPDCVSLFKLESTGVGYYSVYEQLDHDSTVCYSGNGFVLSPFGSMLFSSDDSIMDAYGDCVYTSSLPDYTKLTVTCVIYFGEDEFGSSSSVPVADTFFFEFEANESFSDADYDPWDGDGVTGSAESLGKPSVTYVSYDNEDYPYDGIKLTFETSVDKSHEYITYALGVMFASTVYAYSFDWSSSLIFSKQVVDSNPDNEWSQAIHDQLDDIANRPANPKPPVGANTVTNAGAKEDQLLDNGAAGREEFGTILGGSAASLHLYGSSFAFLSACINPLIDIPWIKEILTISLGLGLTGFILNLGAVAISKHSKDGGKSSGKGGGK